MEPSSFWVVVVALGLLSTVSVPLSTTGVAAGRAACATAACTCALDSNCRASRASKRREWTCFMTAPPALVDRPDPSHRGNANSPDLSDGRLCRLVRFCGRDESRATGNRRKPRSFALATCMQDGSQDPRTPWGYSAHLASGLGRRRTAS